MRRLVFVLLAAFTLSDCSPPPVSYADKAFIVKRRATLQQHLLELLPKEQQSKPEAVQEAKWLADTGYKAAAGISRVNDSHFPGWAGNALINSHLQDRGLCWQYQHDMYRELRRRPLTFFRIGCCVRDGGEASEHNCVYVAAKEGVWPNAWVLDAWMWNGRLKVDDARELNLKRWKDLPEVQRNQALYYPEGHQMPIEFWSMVRTNRGDYGAYWQDDCRASEQYKRMYENIERGKKEHPGSPTNY